MYSFSSIVLYGLLLVPLILALVNHVFNSVEDAKDETKLLKHKIILAFAVLGAILALGDAVYKQSQAQRDRDGKNQAVKNELATSNQLASVLSQQSSLSNQNETLAWQVKSLSIDKQVLTAQIKKLSGQNEILATGNETLTNQNTTLTNQNLTLADQMANLTNQISALSTQNESLSQREIDLTSRLRTFSDALKEINHTKTECCAYADEILSQLKTFAGELANFSNPQVKVEAINLVNVINIITNKQPEIDTSRLTPPVNFRKIGPTQSPEPAQNQSSNTNKLNPSTNKPPSITGLHIIGQ